MRKKPTILLILSLILAVSCSGNVSLENAVSQSDQAGEQNSIEALDETPVPTNTTEPTATLTPTNHATDTLLPTETATITQEPCAEFEFEGDWLGYIQTTHINSGTTVQVAISIHLEQNGCQILGTLQTIEGNHKSTLNGVISEDGWFQSDRPDGLSFQIVDGYLVSNRITANHRYSYFLQRAP
jgi:hypothetical protein